MKKTKEIKNAIDLIYGYESGWKMYLSENKFFGMVNIMNTKGNTAEIISKQKYKCAKKIINRKCKFKNKKEKYLFLYGCYTSYRLFGIFEIIFNPLKIQNVAGQ